MSVTVSNLNITLLKHLTNVFYENHLRFETFPGAKFSCKAPFNKRNQNRCQIPFVVTGSALIFKENVYLKKKNVLFDST